MGARLRDIRRAASAHQIEVTEPSSGSHWQCRRAGSRMYPLPAHNGLRTEIDDKYLSAFCKHFGLDEDEFRKAL
jgi:hypothetical protein